MEAVPEATGACFLGKVAEGVADQLDGGGRVGHENEVEVPRVRAQQRERLFPDFVDGAAGELGRRVGTVRIAIEVRGQAAGEAVYEGPGINGGAAVVEINACRSFELDVSLFTMD